MYDWGMRWVCVCAQVFYIMLASSTSLDTNERDRSGIGYEPCGNWARAYESQLRGSLPKFIVLTQVSRLEDEFRNFIPNREWYSNTPEFRIVGWIWLRYNPYRYDRKFFSSYFPSTEVHSDSSVHLSFISKTDEQNKTQNWCAVVLS